MWAKYAHNSLQKPATGLTPFICVLGYQPPLFPWLGEPSNLPSVTERLRCSEETWNYAHTHLQHAVRRPEQQANHHQRPSPEYAVGQWVWVSTRDLHLRLPCRKLSRRYVGPFKIIKQITPVSFQTCLLFIMFLPLFMFHSLNPLVVREESWKELRPTTSRPSWSTARRCTYFENYSTMW